MKRKLALWVGVLVIVFGAAALALSRQSVQHVGSKQFAVPDKQLFNDTIPWMPAPEAGSFTFVLDPKADPGQIPLHRVLVQSAKEVCEGDGKSQMVRVACGRERARDRLGPPFKKVFPHADYAYAWDYYADGPTTLADNQAGPLQVANCSPIAPNPARPKGTAICTSVWGVEGLVLSLGFEEHELNDIALMRARATKMLLSWKSNSEP